MLGPKSGEGHREGGRADMEEMRFKELLRFFASVIKHLKLIVQEQTVRKTQTHMCRWDKPVKICKEGDCEK